MPPMRQVFGAQTVEDFGAALSAASYTPVPAETLVAITDVVGSTQAIAKGRYKDVNLAGAAAIAAFANSFPDIELPFAFGGDGAIVLLPGSERGRATQVLKGLYGAVRGAMELDLRVALIPIEALRAEGADIGLLYQRLGGGRRLSMLAGGGSARAETLAKSAQGAEFHVSADARAEAPLLNGLSCRWQPIAPQRGGILTLVIEVTGAPDDYRAIFDRVAFAAAGPLSPLHGNPFPVWPPQRLWTEARLAAPRAPMRHAAATLGQSFLGVVSTATGMTIGGFSGQRYRDSLVRHCDSMKFADGLKMVIDCSPDEAAAVIDALEDMTHTHAVSYGASRSDKALMTCFVQTTEDGGHIHFVDGADGGYASAAQSLKERKQR